MEKIKQYASSVGRKGFLFEVIMANEVTLRKMMAGDREIFFEMSRDFYVCGEAHAPITEENRINFWEEVLSGEFISGYIIECNNEVAGYALIAYYASQKFGGKSFCLDIIE